MWGGNLVIRLASIHRFPQRQVIDINGVAILRVSREVNVVPGAGNEVLVIAHMFPCVATIVGAVHPGVAFVFNQRPHPPRPRWRGRYGNLAHDSLWQTRVFADVSPRFAAVGGFVDAAIGATARNLGKAAVRFPKGSINNTRVGRVNAQINRPRLVAAEQHLIPRLAAVGGFINAALWVRAKGMAEGGYIHNVGVGGVNTNFGDVAGIGQPHVAPALAGVGGFVHPVAVGHVNADGGLARSGKNHVGVRVGHGQRTNGRCVEVTIGDTFPIGSCISGFPYATGAAAKVKGIRVVAVASHGDNAPAAKWANTAPFE